MKALLIDPHATPLATVVQVDADPTTWRSVISPDCFQLGRMTLRTELDASKEDRKSEVIAVFDDQGDVTGEPSFSMWSEAHGQRMTISGRALIVSSDEALISSSPKGWLMPRLAVRADD